MPAPKSNQNKRKCGCTLCSEQRNHNYISVWQTACCYKTLHINTSSLECMLPDESCGPHLNRGSSEEVILNPFRRLEGTRALGVGVILQLYKPTAGAHILLKMNTDSWVIFSLCSLATKCQCSRGPAVMKRMEWVSFLSPVSWCLLPFYQFLS